LRREGPFLIRILVPHDALQPLQLDALQLLQLAAPFLPLDSRRPPQLGALQLLQLDARFLPLDSRRPPQLDALQLLQLDALRPPQRDDLRPPQLDNLRPPELNALLPPQLEARPRLPTDHRRVFATGMPVARTQLSVVQTIACLEFVNVALKARQRLPLDNLRPPDLNALLPPQLEARPRLPTVHRCVFATGMHVARTILVVVRSFA
jgi:hypothetical protein